MAMLDVQMRNLTGAICVMVLTVIATKRYHSYVGGQWLTALSQIDQSSVARLSHHLLFHAVPTVAQAVHQGEIHAAAVMLMSTAVLAALLQGEQNATAIASVAGPAKAAVGCRIFIADFRQR